jgi:hypothetical protein
MDRAELIVLVRRIMSAEAASDAAHAALVDHLQAMIRDPNVINYIYDPDVEMTAEQIVDRALAYTSIVLPSPPRP